MHCGKKWWIREFVAPYIFPLNPDYVAARSLWSLRSNKTVAKGFPVTKLLAWWMIGLKLGTGCMIGHGMCDYYFANMWCVIYPSDFRDRCSVLDMLWETMWCLVVSWIRYEKLCDAWWLQKISVICDRYSPLPRVVAKRQLPANFAGWERAYHWLKLCWKTKVWGIFQGAVK